MSKKSFKGTGADLFFSNSSVPVQDTGFVKYLKINPVFKALIPPLSPEEYSQLEENLLQNGIREAISLWNETIIDGHNRHDIAQKHNLPYRTISYDFETENEVILWIIKNQFGRRNLSAYDRSILALRLKPIIAEQAKENLRTHTEQGYQNFDKADIIHTAKELAAIAGVSHDTISRVEKIEQAATPEVKEQLKRGDISIHKAYQDIKQQEKRRGLTVPSSSPLTSLIDTYNVIYADCPWESFDSENRTTTNHNPLMMFKAIKTLRIPADNDAILFMWATATILDKALQVMAAWGFTYHTCAVWDKTKDGMGQYFGGQHEMILIGTKGKFSPPPEAARVSSVYREKPGKHSSKPAYYYELIEQMFPDGHYLELFASNKHSDKWNVWNNQILSGKEKSDNENNI